MIQCVGPCVLEKYSWLALSAGLLFCGAKCAAWFLVLMPGERAAVGEIDAQGWDITTAGAPACIFDALVCAWVQPPAFCLKQLLAGDAAQYRLSCMGEVQVGPCKLACLQAWTGLPYATVILHPISQGVCQARDL